MTAVGNCWCPDHFVCANPQCGIKLIDIGFVEEGGFLYCERDYERYLAPHCKKCSAAIIGVRKRIIVLCKIMAGYQPRS